MKYKRTWLAAGLFFGMCCLTGCGGLADMSSDLPVQVQEKVGQITEKVRDKTGEPVEEEMTADQKTLATLTGLMGKTDADLQKEMSGSGENPQEGRDGQIQSRDYVIRLLGYELTAIVALEQDTVTSVYLDLGGEDYEAWQNKITECIGEPDREEEGEEIRQSVYCWQDCHIVLNSSYGLQYITISPENIEN